MASVNYGIDFTAVVQRDNIYGVQFHPESFLTDEGPKLIANFLTG